MAQLLQEGDIEWGQPVPKGTPLKYVVERGKDGIIKVHARYKAVPLTLKSIPKV